MACANMVTIIDVGSEKLTLVEASRGINATLDIKRNVSVSYDGFADGTFFDEDAIAIAVKDLLTQAGYRKNSLPKNIYVGVPGEFTTVVDKEVSQVFSKPHKITETDMDSILEEGNTFDNESKYVVINSSAIHYFCDDNRRMICPLGIVTTKIKALISYVLCDAKFVRLFNKIFADVGIAYQEYISSIWAEAEYLFDEDMRDKSVLLADVGHITSSVAILQGDGLLHMISFSSGGGYIAADLNMYIDIPYEDADILKRKADLSRVYSCEDMYDITAGDEVHSYNVEQVNEVISARILLLADMINKSISMAGKVCPQYETLYLTGGGITHIRGAKNILAKALNRPVEIVTPLLPLMEQPELSSTLSVVNIALNNLETKNKEKKSFLKRLFGR